MEIVVDFIEKHVVPLSFEISNQRHLKAVGSGFSGLSGLIIISSVCTLIIATLNGIINEDIINLCRTICFGNFSFMGLFACFGIANELWKSYGKDNLQGGFVAIAIFLSISMNNINKETFSVAYLFTAIFVAIISVELLIKIDNIKFIKVRLPKDVPPAVSTTLDSMITLILAIFIFVVFGYVLNTINENLYVSDIITTYIQQPVENVMNSLVGAIIVPLNNSVFWTLGVHGSQAMSLVTNPILSVLSAENMMLAQQGAVEGYNIVTGSFFLAFVWHGGSGATLGLIIAILMCGKKYKSEYKDMLNASIWPGLFNINETVIFATPIVLNPVFAIPFILVPIVNSIVAYVAISIGLVSPCIVQAIPWITPPILSGFLATGSLSGALLSGLTLVLSTLMYMPFVIMSISNRFKA
ncbi:MAG: PTS sugar transporter subunit IIC [Paraclostridium sp.]